MSVSGPGLPPPSLPPLDPAPGPEPPEATPLSPAPAFEPSPPVTRRGAPPRDDVGARLVESRLTEAAAAVDTANVHRIEADVEALYRAMAGLGTDEEAIFDILENRDPAAREAIEELFAAKYGDAWVTLRVALDDELSGDEHQRAMDALNAGRDYTSRGEIMLDRGRAGDAGRPLRKFITWFEFGIGGKSDAEDGLPRLTGAAIRDELLPQLRPGDVILNGNNGGLSHAMLYLGDGKVIHAMATEKTMCGRAGRLWDTVRAPVDILRENLGMKPRKQGVFIERVDAFFDRFERDTYVVMRAPNLTPERAERGLARLRQLVGKPYDWDFAPGNDAYYCSEVATEFLRAALGEDAPRIGARAVVHRPLLYRDAVVDPLDIFASPDLEPVACNAAAQRNFAERLGGI